MDFRADGTLAVSVLDGFALLRPPRFRRVELVADGAGAMDHNVFMRWSRTSETMMVLSDFGCAVYRPGSEDPVATFEAAGLFVAQASSPATDETAVLYPDFMAVHAADGAIAVRAEVEASSGELHWSHDGQLIAVAWQREGAAGFMVLDRSELRLVHAAERHRGSGRVLVAWHPSRRRLAFAEGSVVRVRDFDNDPESP